MKSPPNYNEHSAKALQFMIAMKRFAMLNQQTHESLGKLMWMASSFADQERRRKTTRECVRAITRRIRDAYFPEQMRNAMLFDDINVPVDDAFSNLMSIRYNVTALSDTPQITERAIHFSESNIGGHHHGKLFRITTTSPFFAPAMCTTDFLSNDVPDENWSPTYVTLALHLLFASDPSSWTLLPNSGSNPGATEMVIRGLSAFREDLLKHVKPSEIPWTDDACMTLDISSLPKILEAADELRAIPKYGLVDRFIQERWQIIQQAEDIYLAYLHPLGVPGNDRCWPRHYCNEPTHVSFAKGATFLSPASILFSEELQNRNSFTKAAAERLEQNGFGNRARDRKQIASWQLSAMSFFSFIENALDPMSGITLDYLTEMYGNVLSRQLDTVYRSTEAVMALFAPEILAASL